VQAWDVRNSCKHNGAVLPFSAAPVGRGADGVDAGNLMMSWLAWLLCAQHAMSLSLAPEPGNVSFM
jgi:hypothetical protein